MSSNGSPSLLTILEKSPSKDDSDSSEGESSGSPLMRVCNMMIPVIPLTTMPSPEEISTLQTVPIKPQWTTTPTTLPEELMAHPKG
jgi:hypothetical protein